MSNMRQFINASTGYPIVFNPHQIVSISPGNNGKKTLVSLPNQRDPITIDTDFDEFCDWLSTYGWGGYEAPKELDLDDDDDPEQKAFRNTEDFGGTGSYYKGLDGDAMAEKTDKSTDNTPTGKPIPTATDATKKPEETKDHSKEAALKASAGSNLTGTDTLAKTKS